MKPALARCALAFVMAIAAARAGDPLETVVPDTAFVLFRVKNGSSLAAKWRTTSYYAFWNHPETRRALEAPSTGVAYAAGAAAASLGLSLDSVQNLLAGQYGFYVCTAELGRGSGAESAGVFDAGAAGRAIFDALAQASSAQRGGANLVEPFAGGRILPAPLGAARLALATVKDALVLASPVNAARNAITRLQTPPREPLASLPAFRSMSHTLAQDSDVIAYVNARPLLALLEREGSLPAEWQAALAATGLDGVEDLAASLRIDEAVYLTVRLRVKGERRGLLRLAGGPARAAAPARAGALATLLMAAVFSPHDNEEKPPSQKARELEEALRRAAAEAEAQERTESAAPSTQESPAPDAQAASARRRPASQRLIRGALERGEQIPADVARFTTLRVQPRLAWEVLEQAGAALAPAAVQAVKGQLEAVAQRAGARDAAEILGLLGSRAVVFTRYVKPYLNADAEQTVAVIEAASRPALEQRLAALRQAWPEAFSPRSSAEGEYLVFPCKLNGGEVFYCLAESHLIVANNSRAALDYIRFASYSMSSLSDQDAFALAMAKLPPEEQRVLATYHNPAVEFLYRTDRMRANILDPGVEAAVRAAPLASLFVAGARELRNTQALALALPVSASALCSTPDGAAFTSYHAGP